MIDKHETNKYLKRLHALGYTLAPLGVEFRKDNEPYFCTPKYSNIIGWAGVDGIHSGITSGFIMALTMSLDDFVVSYFVSDLRSTLSVYMYSAARGAKGVNPALATIIFIPLVTLLLIVNLRRISKEREDEIQNKKVKMKG